MSLNPYTREIKQLLESPLGYTVIEGTEHDFKRQIELRLGQNHRVCYVLPPHSVTHRGHGLVFASFNIRLVSRTPQMDGETMFPHDAIRALQKHVSEGNHGWYIEPNSPIVEDLKNKTTTSTLSCVGQLYGDAPSITNSEITTNG